jgi:UDP-N-acetylglucosamine--N-acetylmuramyl-(pentapeptide) pyrophosphoryl-undecaprenol N-acetylglucosamine transferase
VYVGQRGDALSDIPAKDPHVDAVYSVRAGKFRRYHGEGLKQLLDLPTVVLNIRDAGYVLAGLWQSFWLLRKLKPQVVFTRGGFVSVPVALGGKLSGVPYITHDSDSIPSLANRIIGRWANLHAVALPEELYPYPRDKTVMVGVPVDGNYQLVTPQLQRQFKEATGIPADHQVVLITGGGNGARRLNQDVLDNAKYLLGRYPKLTLVHATGRAHETEVAAAYDRLLAPAERSRVVTGGFFEQFYRYSGAADVIIARGSATNLAEFALQAKACVVVPAGQLVWTVQNSKALAARGAIVELTEDQAEQERRLASVISELLDNSERRNDLGKQLSLFAHPQAAKQLAEILISIGTSKI